MLLLALLLGVVTGIANVAGAYLAVLRVGASPGKDTSGLIGFGGGFILAAAIFEMLPESLEGGAAMPAFVAAGYLVVYVAEQVFASRAHEIPANNKGSIAATDNPSVDHTLVGEFRHGALPISLAGSIAALIGFIIHDFVDGLAIGAGMVTSQTLGLLMFLAVLVHEIPAGFAIGTIMLGAGRGRRAAMLAGASIGVITLFGIAVPFLVEDLSSTATYAFLALSAGTFIYIAASDLIPVAAAGRSRGVFLFVLLGFGMFVASQRLLEFVAG